MSTSTYQPSTLDMTPEQVGMLNGRAAALQAATADLLDRGYLRQTPYGRLEASTSGLGSATDLQREIYRAVQTGAPRLETVPQIRSELDALQRDAVRSGLLNPPRRGTSMLAIIPLLVLGIVAAAAIMRSHAAMPLLLAGPFCAVLLFHIVRLLRSSSKERRAAAGKRALEAARARVPHPVQAPGTQATAATGLPRARAGLGYTVGPYGTRPLLVAFPAAAALGWGLTDHAVEEELHRRALGANAGSSGFTCSSGSSSSDWSCDTGSSHTGDAWCSGGNCCRCGGSCKSGSCGGGSSCGGSSCGSSCGGSSCSS